MNKVMNIKHDCQKYNGTITVNYFKNEEEEVLCDFIFSNDSQKQSVLISFEDLKEAMEKAGFEITV